MDGNVWAVASDDVAANATGAAYHEAGSRRLGSLYRAKNHTDRPRRPPTPFCSQKSGNIPACIQRPADAT